MKKKVSICVPIKDEEKNIENFYDKIINIVEPLKNKYEFEIIFTDNASKDNSEKIIENICKKNLNVKYIKFEKNYGYEKSLEINYLNASGDALISIDCDMQDPPELIPKFIEKWEDGYELVTGKRDEEKGFSFSLMMKKVFYSKILLKNSEMSLSGDFRLISKKIQNYLTDNINNDLFLRSFLNNVNLKRTTISYKRSSRKLGKSKTNLFSNFQIILKALTYERNTIFQMISLINLVAFSFAILLAIYYLITKIFELQNLPQGLASIHILVLSSIGLNGISFCIIFLYLKKVLIKDIKSEAQILRKINLEN